MDRFTWVFLSAGGVILVLGESLGGLVLGHRSMGWVRVVARVVICFRRLIFV